MINLYVKWTVMKERIMEAMQDESGLGTIEIAVIIIVLIGLALMFKTQITAYLTKLTGSLGVPAVEGMNGVTPAQ